MNTPVTISVVMPVYNREKFIRQALDSVLAQTLPPLEIIVVDDGSTDGTRDILKDYGRRVRTIRTRNSGGCSVPRNIAIREAKGSHIALMDSDDIWFRKKLEHQVDIARLHPGVDFICSDFITRHEDRKLVHQFGEKRYGAEIRAQDLVFDRPFDAFPLLLSRNFVGCPSTVVFSKRLIDKVGYFTALYDSVEDFEYWLRCARVTPFICLSVPTVYKRVHSSNMSANRVNILMNRKRILQGLLSSNDSYVTEHHLRMRCRWALAGVNFALARTLHADRINDKIALYLESFFFYPRIKILKMLSSLFVTKLAERLHMR